MCPKQGPRPRKSIVLNTESISCGCLKHPSLGGPLLGGMSPLLQGFCEVEGATIAAKSPKQQPQHEGVTLLVQNKRPLILTSSQ